MYRFRRVWLGRVLVAALGLVGGLIVCEGALRIAGIGFPLYNRADPGRGFAQVPGHSFVNTLEGQPVRVEFNREGFRDPERSVQKPPGVYRIAVLGDSFTSAYQVAIGDRFTEVLARKLDECRAFGKIRVEVLNFGNSGYGTAQEVLTLRLVGWKYAPDLVLLAYFTGNDLSDNSKELDHNPLRPYFVLAGDRLQLELPPWFGVPVWKKVAYFALDHSRVLQLAHRLIQGRSLAANQAGWAERGDNLDILPPVEPRRVRAWQITERILAQLAAETRERHAHLLVATIADASWVHAARLSSAAAAEGPEVASYPEDRIAQLGASSGFGVIRLGPPMRRAARLSHELFYFQGYGHWNERGHRLAGKLLARRICSDRKAPMATVPLTR